MTLSEFSDQFEVLYSDIMSNAAPGLNEYEKSVFLTKAQYEIVKNYFNPLGNKYKEGFDGSAKRQMDFSMLMCQRECASSTGSGSSYDPRAELYAFPDNLFIPVNESVQLIEDDRVQGIRQVIPISYEEYLRKMSKPYKEPLKNQAWRLITGQESSGALVELILNSNDKTYEHKYIIRYVRRPQPIITVNLTTIGNVSIDNVTTASECELDPSVHQEILQRAVELAKASYAADQNGQLQMQNQVTVGQRSE